MTAHLKMVMHSQLFASQMRTVASEDALMTCTGVALKPSQLLLQAPSATYRNGATAMVLHRPSVHLAAVSGEDCVVHI